MVFKKGQKAWNKGKKCFQFSGSNNGMYGKKRHDLVIRNKSKENIEKVRSKLIGHSVSVETRKKIGAKSKLYCLRKGKWKGADIRLMLMGFLLHEEELFLQNIIILENLFLKEIIIVV